MSNMNTGMAAALKAAKLALPPKASAPPKGVSRPLTPAPLVNGVLQAPPAAAPVFAPDSGYNNDVDQAHRVLVAALGGIDTNEAATKYDYGFEDTSNPFSRVAQEKQNYLNTGKRVGNQLGAQGQLYSSARTKALATNDTNHDQAVAALTQAYNALINQYGTQRATAGNAEQAARIQALQAAMTREGVA